MSEMETSEMECLLIAKGNKQQRISELVGFSTSLWAANAPTKPADRDFPCIYISKCGENIFKDMGQRKPATSSFTVKVVLDGWVGIGRAASIDGPNGLSLSPRNTLNLKRKHYGKDEQVKKSRVLKAMVRPPKIPKLNGTILYALATICNFAFDKYLQRGNHATWQAVQWLKSDFRLRRGCLQ